MEDESLKKFNDTLNEIWKNQECPICKNKEFSTLSKVFELREFNGGNIIVGEGNQIFPVVPVVCNHCGYSLFFNSIVIKEFLEKNEKKPK